MNSQPDQDPDRRLLFLLGLLADDASIDGDVLELSNGRWAIHGEIPVDGEILMAEFDTYDEARYVLDQVRYCIPPASDL